MPEIVGGQNAQSMRVKRSDPQKIRTSHSPDYQRFQEGGIREEGVVLHVCRPARELRTGKSPKVLPECSRECSQKSGCSQECSRVLSRVLFLLFCTERAPLRALSGALLRAPRFLRALSRALGEHFRRFPCSRQTRKRCARLSQIVCQICAKPRGFRFFHQRKGAQNCRQFVVNSKINFGHLNANTPFFNLF